MFSQEPCEIDSFRQSANDAPVSSDHNAVCAMGAAQRQRGNQILRAAKARLVELEECEICLPPRLEAADVVAAETRGRALCRPP